MNDNSIKQEILVAINNILNRNKGSKYATLQEIYSEVASNKKVEQTPELEAQIRARLQEHSSQYSNYLGKEDLFETKKKNSGLWRNKTTGERELKNYVLDIIGKFPGIDITTLQHNLLKLLENDLTDGDKLESLTRPGEMKIEQIIRNFVSHKDSYKKEIDFVSSENGLTRLFLKESAINKMEEINEDDTSEIYSDENYINTVINAESEVPLVPKTENKLLMTNAIPLTKKRKSIDNKKYIRKSDFTSYIDDYQKKLDNGYLAEGLVFEFEKDKLISIGRTDLAEKVKWISRDLGDGYGYDIKSYEIVNNIEKEIYIEVKSTTGSLSGDFEMSANEYKFALDHQNDKSYKIYRVAKKDGKNIGYIIEDNLVRDFNISPSSYKISIKE